MDRKLLFIGALLVFSLAGCASISITPHPTTRDFQHGIKPALQVLKLPAQISFAEDWPATISDPLLQAAWTQLYRSMQACPLWDGYTLTGQMLAQYVIDRAVIVDWNTNPAYLGSWVDRFHAGTIYLNPGLKKKGPQQMTYLVSDLAHEIFHHSQPFNQVEDTLYEEYWAFYVGACVSGQSLRGFKNTQPLSSASLAGWFRANRRGNYLGEFTAYPANVAALSMP